MDRTQINGSVQETNSTVINSQANSSTTVVNQSTQNGSAITPGTLLCEVYEVMEKLDIVAGEADLYLCTFAARKYVAKIYRRRIAIKPEVSQRLSQIHSPFVARIFAMGEYEGYPVEILPFFSHGSLSGRTFNYDQLKYEIIPSVNEGLHVLHENGIIHKDVKPSNIMLNNDGRTASIIDFGISSLRENGATVVVTKTGLTPEYSAPETFRNLFLNESDYYSFGVTIYELYCGHTPYSEMSQEEIEQFISIQKLPMPDGMEKDLQELINALTYPDITNRRDKSNPNRRWGYEEICNWCNDIPQPLPGGTVNQTKAKESINRPVQNSEDDMLPYRFGGKSITSTSVLVDALNGRWEEAKKHLLRGLLLAHFQKDSNAEIISNLMDIEEEADSVDADILLFKSFYLIDSTLRDFLWKGERYSDLSELGNRYLLAIRSNDTEFLQTMDEIVDKGILTQYYKLINPEKKEQINALSAVESRFKLSKATANEKLHNSYQLAYLLSDKKDYVVDGKSFHDINSFADYVSLKASEIDCTFEKTLRDIVYKNKTFDIQFTSWLEAVGQSTLIEGQNSDKNFFRLVYNMRSEIKTLLWEGHEFIDLKDLGIKWLKALRERDNEFVKLANSMLSLGILTYYAENVDVLKKRKLDKLKKAEASSSTLSSLGYNEFYLFEYTMAYLLSEEKTLRFNGDEFDSPDKLLMKLDSLLDTPGALASYCSSIISDSEMLDPQIESWVSACLTIDEASKYRKTLLQYRTYADLLLKKRALFEHADEATEKEAIEMADMFNSVLEFKDSVKHVKECLELAFDIKYNGLVARLTALSSVQPEKLEKHLHSIADGFAELGDYKNAKELEAECRGEIANIEKRIKYEKTVQKIKDSAYLSQAEREKIYLESADAFEELGEYKDALAKAKEYRDKAKGVRMIEVYNMAIKKKNQAKKAATIEEQQALYIEAAKLFESVISLYDAKQQIVECNAAVNELSDEALSDD